MTNADNTPDVRVLIVDDSAFMRLALSRMISSDPAFSVVGTACSGLEALERIGILNPDVITLDVQMPGMDGLETLSAIMAQHPRPVIMVSALTVKEAETTFRALEAGAFDYVPKQLSSDSLDILHIREDLLSKMRAGAESHRLRTDMSLLHKPPRAVVAPAPSVTVDSIALIALGTSTGGPKALREILPSLPADLPAPIFVVQHMPAGFTAPFAERLNNVCAISVREACHGESAQPGAVYIAPSGSHMTVNRAASRTVIALSDKPLNQPHTPSIDILMESVAHAGGPRAMGIILTGMGTDGARGMEAIHRAGGFTVGQDVASSAVYSMPGACAERGILDRIVPLSQISSEIVKATRVRKASAS